MANYAMIDANNIVINIIVWDGQTAYTPPDGTTLIADDGMAKTGGTWDGSKFVFPNVSDVQNVDTTQST